MDQDDPGYQLCRWGGYQLGEDGEDISWERMEMMDKHTLVCRFMGKSVSVRSVNKWVEDCW